MPVPSLWSVFLLWSVSRCAPVSSLAPYRLRVEYEESPIGLDVSNPRFFWALSLGDSVSSTNHFLSPDTLSSSKNTNYDSISTRGDYQSAYQLQIFNLNLNAGSYIDSGRISTSETTHITVETFNPVSHGEYKWCVYVWNSTSTSSHLSDASSGCDTFSMALLNGESDWEGAQWLGITDPSNTAYFYHTNEFRFEFSLSASEAQRGISKAKCYIASPNFYKAWINGKELDQHRLGYFTTFEERAYYDTIDCKDLISSDSKDVNVFALMLGQGWYSQPSVNVGVPMFRVLVYLELSNVTDIVTFASNSSTWYTHEGPVRMNDIYVGEFYDCAYETPGWLTNSYNMTAAGGWMAASEISNATIGVLKSSAIMPKIEITESFAPVAVTQPDDGIFVVDFGQNVAGAIEIRIPGNNAKGQNLTIRYSEQLYPNGTVQDIYQQSAAPSPMITRYALRGDGQNEVFEAFFTSYGFQYVEIEGFPGVVTSDTISSYLYRSNFNTNGAISFGPSSVETMTSGELLNQIQRMTRYASLSNFMNIPSDCPQRERRGWLGDGQLTAEVAIFNFDMAASYTKWLNDIIDAQNNNNMNGAIPDTAPYYGHGASPGDPTWTTALIFITHWMYRYFGDVQIVENNYDNMQQQMTYMDTQLESNHIIPASKSYYGDWCAIPNSDTSRPCGHTSDIINTWDYVRQCDYMAQMATLLGKDNDAVMYLNKSALSKNAIKKNYFDASKGYFIESDSVAPVSTLQALCLEMGVLDNETEIQTTLQAMVDDVVVKGKGHIYAGIVGIKYILKELCELGACEVALNASIRTDFPSFGYWYENGATTLWERLSATRYNTSGSKNHIMFGTQGVWYYQHLAGIKQNEDSNNWNQFEVKPYYNASVFDIFYIEATVDTQVGTIYVQYQVQETQNFNETWLTLQVNVPVGSQASLYVSRLAQFGTYVSVNDWIVKETVANATVWQNSAFIPGAAKGVLNGTVQDDDNIVFDVQSGMYIFQLFTS